MAYEWLASEYERLSPITQDARALLERWFHAIESGEVVRYRPDPQYTVVIPQAVCDAIVDRLGVEFDHDLRSWANLEAAGSYDAGPGFDRLTPPQRLALAQQLHALKRKHGKNVSAAYQPYGYYPPPTPPSDPPTSTFVATDYIS